MAARDSWRRAWCAFEDGRYAEADRLFRAEEERVREGEERDALRRRHGYVLVALGRFDEARALYRDLFDRTGSHRDLHQMGMVEREAGALEAATAIFEQEARLLAEGDALAAAANLYERSLLAHLAGDRPAALAHMARCLDAAKRCGDATTEAVASRLEGDLFTGRDRERARAAYRRSLAGFRRAGDLRGAEEVERRLEEG